MSYLFPTYARWEIEPESASGSTLTDKNGKKYLDFTSGIGVCILGHRPNNVEEAVRKQLKQFWHVSNLFQSENQETAAKKLAEAAGLDRVFFANSGAEANEAAIKLARKATGKTKIITFKNSFHGRTFATMSATGQDKIKHGFGPMLETFVNVSYNDIEAVNSEMGNDVAAVMIEAVQGEGGIHVGKKDFLQGVQELCKQYGTLFIIDEIQTGIGRTGKPFAFQHFDLDPDLITSAKGLGSGFPIGAVIGKEKLEPFFGQGSHGSTFGGNPVSLAAAIATMDAIFKEEFLDEVVEKSEFFFKQLRNNLNHLTIIKDIRGMGLMVGIECKLSAAPLLSELRKMGLIALPAGEKVIRLLPPLTVSKEELKYGVYIIKEILEKESLVADKQALLTK
ncbi:aspartate aminotransferase family protein [Bacillus sp. AFS076308]|uniref:acetylornithine transaminase n=1 Tax=Bacillus sp. AFS076308 TaxID=2033512 RepID=UPI000BF58F50|nr:acetylornithine transaminase [Bacillus sp. AFS076308]PFO01360.1 aspartate aminotransferase family protein [Bacillus sp. AFS076308]